MRAFFFIKFGAKMTVMATVLGMLIHGTRAANIIWSEPAIISGEADVATLGTLDRAYNLGSTGKVVTVNGVSFTPFATKATGDEFSDGRTTLAVSGDGDGLATAATLPGSGLTGFTPDYRGPGGRLTSRCITTPGAQRKTSKCSPTDSTRARR